MILNDRQEDYTNNNKSLCEEDCVYVGYDKINKQVECSCSVKIDFPSISDVKIDKKKLYKFMDIKKIGNFNVLKILYSKLKINNILLKIPLNYNIVTHRSWLSFLYP